MAREPTAPRRAARGERDCEDAGRSDAPGPRDCEDVRRAALRGELAGWGRCWGIAGFEDRVHVSFSRRFRRSLGRCAPASGDIRLAAFLLDAAAPPALLREALCHEAAHAAVYLLHGRGTRPHGAQWRSLMRLAGFEPRARFPAALLDGIAPAPARSRARWLHRCPVCQARRVARRAVHGWRCSACLQAGLDGRLLITRLADARGAPPRPPDARGGEPGRVGV